MSSLAGEGEPVFFFFIIFEGLAVVEEGGDVGFEGDGGAALSSFGVFFFFEFFDFFAALISSIWRWSAAISSSESSDKSKSTSSSPRGGDLRDEEELMLGG